MDTDIYALVAKYGFKNLHIRLEEIMRDEYAYFQTKFQAPVVVPNTIIVSEVQEKKQRKTKVKKAQLVEPIEQSEDVQLSLENTELKDVIVTVTEKTNNFRDPKEMKEFMEALDYAVCSGRIQDIRRMLDGLSYILIDKVC